MTLLPDLLARARRDVSGRYRRHGVQLYRHRTVALCGPAVAQVDGRHHLAPERELNMAVTVAFSASLSPSSAVSVTTTRQLTLTVDDLAPETPTRRQDHRSSGATPRQSVAWLPRPPLRRRLRQPRQSSRRAVASSLHCPGASPRRSRVAPGCDGNPEAPGAARSRRSTQDVDSRRDCRSAPRRRRPGGPEPAPPYPGRRRAR